MNLPFILAFVLVGSIVGLVFLLAFLDKTDTDTFKILVGALMSVGFTNVIGFYFGSSVSSKAKDDTINAIATGTGVGTNGPAAVAAAAAVAAPIAAAAAAPPAAEIAAPPAAEAAVAQVMAAHEQEQKP